jgi:hypothetical protein
LSSCEAEEEGSGQNYKTGLSSYAVLVYAIMTGNVLSAEHLPNTQGSSVITELTGI